MEKHGRSILTNLAGLLVLFLLFSSFISLSSATAVAETKHSFWSAMQDFSLQKLGFWQKTALLLGASGGSYMLFRKRYRRHYDNDLGCLGVLGIIVLGALVIAFLPLIIVVGLFMLILGIPFPRFRGRRYDHDYHHRRHRRHW